MKIVSLIYHTVKSKVKPVYSSTTGYLTINQRIVLQLPETERLNCVWFKLEFAGYTYQQVYDPFSRSYRQTIHKKIYHLVLYINLDVYFQPYTIPHLHNLLTNYLVQIQISRIQKGITNYVSSTPDCTESIKNFIAYHSANLVYFGSWHLFKINAEYVYNLSTKRFV